MRRDKTLRDNEPAAKVRGGFPTTTTVPTRTVKHGDRVCCRWLRPRGTPPATSRASTAATAPPTAAMCSRPGADWRPAPWCRGATPWRARYLEPRARAAKPADPTRARARAARARPRRVHRAARASDAARDQRGRQATVDRNENRCRKVLLARSRRRLLPDAATRRGHAAARGQWPHATGRGLRAGGSDPARCRTRLPRDRDRQRPGDDRARKTHRTPRELTGNVRIPATFAFATLNEAPVRFPPASVVVAASLLAGVPDPAAALDELWTCVAPGGALLIVEPSEQMNPANARRLLANGVDGPGRHVLTLVASRLLAPCVS